MNQEIIEILKEIKSESHLEILLPNKLSNSLKSIGLSLYEICLLSEEDFKKIDKLGVAKHKLLKGFIEEISINPSLITEFKKHILYSPIILPHILDFNRSIASNIFQTLTDLNIVFQERTLLPKKYFKKGEHKFYSNIQNYINYYFGINTFEVLNYIEIGQKYGVSDESIRTNLFDFKNRPDLVDLFLHNETAFSIKINSRLITESKKILETYLYSSKFIENFVSKDDDFSELQLERIVQVFGYEITKIEFEGFDYEYKTLVNKGREVGEFKSYFRVFDSIFREGNRFSSEELKIETTKAITKLKNAPYNKLIKQNGLNERMFSILLNDYFKIEKIEEDESIIYQYKWQYLSSQIAKSTRILFENNSVMSKKEIFEEFQNRENELGIDFSIESIDSVYIKATDKIHPIGKTGNRGRIHVL